MASGYSVTGGTSRCFPYWQEYMACYVMTKDDTALREQGPCLPRLEDYYECLHHKKEYARASAMQAAMRRAERAHPRENVPKVGQIKSLGLLGHDDDSKALMESATKQ